MADAYKIVITSQSGGSSAPKNPIAGDDNESKETQPTEKNNKDIGGYVAFKKYVAPFLRQGVQYHISTVELRTGNSERQARAQSMYSISSQIFGIGESIWLGYKVGNVPGAIAGAILSVAQTTIGYAQQQNTINLQRGLENQTISMLNVRSGAVNGNRR